MIPARIPAVAGLLAALATGGLQAQAMLTLRERSPDGDTLAIGKSGIVDINSTLLIGINRDSLRTLASSRVTPAGGIADLLARLEAVVRVRDAALAAIGPALAAWESSAKDSAARVALRGSLHPTLDLARQVINAAPRGSRLRDRLNQALREAVNRPGGLEDVYGAVFAAAADEADALRIERDSLLKAAGVFVQVGGWSVTGKGTRPLHFPGFDQNPDLEDFEVERFGIGAIALTAEQKEELKRAGDIAKAFNERGAGAGLADLSSGIRSSVASAIMPLLDEATRCLDQLRNEADGLAQLPGALTANAKARLDTALAPLKDLRAAAAALATKYAGEAPAGQSMADFLIGTNDDLVAFYRKAESAKTSLVTVEAVLAALPAAAGGDVARRLTGLRGHVRECGDSLQLKLAAARSSADGLLQNLLGVRRINADILAFTDAVLRLDLDHVPESVEFRLRYSGERQDGDRLLVRALLGTAGDPSPAREDHELIMYRIQLHLETIIGLVFADPLGSSQVTGRFQAGPSYSILFKRGSRRSVARNRFLLIGAGLNVAALDFNHDDTPELGVGGVVSWLGDYLQAGIGYNVPRDRGYWFFGLRLPLPTFTLPGTSGVDTGG